MLPTRADARRHYIQTAGTPVHVACSSSEQYQRVQLGHQSCLCMGMRMRGLEYALTQGRSTRNRWAAPEAAWVQGAGVGARARERALREVSLCIAREGTAGSIDDTRRVQGTGHHQHRATRRSARALTSSSSTKAGGPTSAGIVCRRAPRARWRRPQRSAGERPSPACWRHLSGCGRRG